MPRRRSPKPSAFTNRAEGYRNEGGRSDLRGHGYRGLNGYVDCRRRSWTCQCALGLIQSCLLLHGRDTFRFNRLDLHEANLDAGRSVRARPDRSAAASCLKKRGVFASRWTCDRATPWRPSSMGHGCPQRSSRDRGPARPRRHRGSRPGLSDPSDRPTTCRGRRAPRPTCGSDPTADRTPSSPNTTGHPARRLRRSRPSRASRPPPGSPAP